MEVEAEVRGERYRVRTMTESRRADARNPSVVLVADFDGPRGAHLKSLRRGILVLDVLIRASEPLTAGRLAELLGIERTIMHRILRTLQVEEMVVRRGGGYVPGPRVLQFGNNFLRRHPLRLASLPYQIDLLYRGYPDQPWALSVLMRVHYHMTLVTQIWSPNAPLDSLLGVPEYTVDRSASGRCILAHLPYEEVESLVGGERAQELEPRLADIRAAGGVDFGPDGGRPDGLFALAALIRTRSGYPIAGLAMSGAGLAPHLARDSELSQRLVRTAARIGNLLN
jgi:IclR family transcriptional regulator, acetate operon repressor